MGEYARSRKLIAFVAAFSPVLLLASGCSPILTDGTPGDPVGSWASTDGASYITLDADHTGKFTLCREETSSTGHRYRYSAIEWPSTIPISWESSDGALSGRSSSDNRVYLYQDWERHQATGVGFDAMDRPLFWDNGNLEMGVEGEVVYEKVPDDAAHC